MASYNIAVIRGDGVGVEVIEEGLKVLRAVGRLYEIDSNFVEHPWGSDYYLEHAEMMPPDGLERLAEADSIYLGAVGHPDIQDHVTLNGLLLPIRRTFDQYVCERPSVLYPGVESPLRDKSPGDIDMVVVRENTEGEYADVGGFQYAGFAEEVGIQTSVFTRRGCERVITYAFELARRRDRKRLVTSITKSNAQGYGMIVWDRAFDAVAERYPDVRTQSLLIDAACMDFVRRPESFGRGRREQPVRRHPHGHRRNHHRQHGTGRQRKHRPGAAVPLHVRAGARQCPRHSGPGHRQPNGGNPVRRHDARPPGTRRRAAGYRERRARYD